MEDTMEDRAKTIGEMALSHAIDTKRAHDILKVENESLRELIDELQRKRLEEIDELKAMRAMITDLRVELSAITEG